MNCKGRIAWYDRKENKYDDYLKGNIFMAYNLGLTARYNSTKLIFYTSTREIYGDINDNIFFHLDFSLIHLLIFR